jgi:N-carbamoyl-L-amino-acid hydrolase
VPSHNGLSHNESEFTEQDDLHRGVDLLLALLADLCLHPEAADEVTPC